MVTRDVWMSDLPVLAAAIQNDKDGSVQANADQTVIPTEPQAPITEEEVGEYREQDRFLPVRCTCLWTH